KVQNARVRYLEPDELARVLSAAHRDVAALWLVPAITIAVHTGLRQGELLRLRRTDLSPTLRLSTIPLTKTAEVKHVPRTAEVPAALAALPRHGATVFAWPWASRSVGSRSTTPSSAPWRRPASPTSAGTISVTPSRATW